jgi:hypothetical protein
MQITLTNEDMKLARELAQTRRSESRSKGLHDYRYDRSKSGEDVDYLGALGEIALAKALGEDPALTEGTFKAADHVDRWELPIQVRATDRLDGRLIIRSNDDPDHWYVLVTIDGPVATIGCMIDGKSVQSREAWRGPARDVDDVYWFVPRGSGMEISHYLRLRN